MSKFRIIAILVFTSIFGGCSNLRGTKLLIPENFGLVQIDKNIYIEAGANEEAKAKIISAASKAEVNIRSAYGSVKSQPTVHACITEECYSSFGGMGSIAKVYGDHILLSPRGLNWHFLAHEWSHSEISTRLTFFAWKRMPQWFDEGVAVVISEAPEHSESHWQFLVANNIPRPEREDLYAIKSLRQWLDAVHRYREDKNIDRKAKGVSEIRPLYTAAGHEVRPWLSEVGSQGLLALIKRLNDGEAFESIYFSAKSVQKDAGSR